MTSPGRWVRSHPGLDNLIAISERGDQGRRHAVKELISRIRCASSSGTGRGLPRYLKRSAAFAFALSPAAYQWAAQTSRPFFHPILRSATRDAGTLGLLGCRAWPSCRRTPEYPFFISPRCKKGLRSRSAAAVASVYGMAIGLFSAKTWAGLTSAAAAPFGHLLGFNGQ